MDFDHFVALLGSSTFTTAKASDWNEDWNDSWVAFADLIGFADRSLRSDAAIVNQLVRFHRSLSHLTERYGEVRLLAFTDAAFAAAPDPTTIVKWAADLQHLCLGANKLTLDAGRRLFHAMLAPRITIAHGRLLAVTPNASAPYMDGVILNGLFIGEAVVNAYKIEKGSAGSLVSIASLDVETARPQLVRGQNQGPRHGLQRWLDQPWPSHDHVVDFPWLLLRPEQPEDDALWADSRQSVAAKARLRNEVWELSFAEYVVKSLPTATVKHYGAVKRHLVEVLQALEPGRNRRSPWTIDRLSQQLNRPMRP